MSGFVGLRAVRSNGWLLAAWLIALPLTSAGALANDGPPDEQARFFESKVRPLLDQHCWKCHGADKQKGDLRLDSRADVLRGGESGPALVPGKPEESLLLEAVRHESLKMPPTGKLAGDEIAVLERWIQLGAPWPGDNGAITKRPPRQKITAEDRAWWAFQPVREPAVPSIDPDAWSRGPIDKFILTRLRAEGLTPSPEADRPSLARRLYFDLIGLPPSPAQVAAFVADQAPDAYERLVDALLAQPEYGERWARYWLDLVRYADSDGYRIDDYRPQAFRYRDYVIQALNDDKPYDRFVQEQLAGDELFPGDPQALVATGYLRHWIYEYNNRDVRGQWTTILNDITNTTADVFLGLGLQCAQCHDHKFDPILQQDYYRLQAFFAALRPRDDLTSASEAERAEHERRTRAWEAETTEVRAELDALEAPYRFKAAEAAIIKFPDDLQLMLRKEPAARTPLEQQLAELAYRQVDYEFGRILEKIKGDDKEKALALRRRLAEHDSLRPAPLPLVMAVTDVGREAPPILIPKRGDEPVAPGFLTLLDEHPPTIEPLPQRESLGRHDSTGRRATLARWLSRADNPLTTRVIVNRIWQFHFGRGLAPNASDFGRLGGPPSHPELLDWLATRFVRDGWSWKKLHRQIVTSATWRQATGQAQFALQQPRDPANRFYWRADTRRLDAEQIRDAILSVTGELSPEHGGPPVTAEIPRRTIYTRYMRGARNPLLDVFDLPQFFASSATRDTTTTPIQSLLLINSQTMLRLATKFAERALQDNPTADAQVAAAWQWAYGRAPTDGERAEAGRFLAQQQRRIAADSPTQTLQEITTGKLPYRDGQAVALDAAAPQLRLTVPNDPLMPNGDFTVEAFFQLRSIYESGAVRGLVAKRHDGGKSPGWLFGVTGKGSRRKPQTLVMQFHGAGHDGKLSEAAIFSDHHIELNKPYYAAASVRLAGERPGSVTFFLKDLSNDDEPLLTAELPLAIQGGLANEEPLTIGATSTLHPALFDGLIDDVRLSRGALTVDRLLFTSEATTAETAGYWQFEAALGMFHDASGHELNIKPGAGQSTTVDARRAAFVDFCHALLNSNEFLYVH